MKIIKKKYKWVAVLLATAMFAGCAESGKNTNSARPAEDPETEFSFLEIADDAWSDNNVDELHAVFNLPLSGLEVEGEFGGTGGGRFLAEGGGFWFQSHVFSDRRKSWFGVRGITVGGEEIDLRVEVDPDGTAGLPEKLGAISGRNGYVAYGCDSRDGEVVAYQLYELDENFQTTRHVTAEAMGGRALDSLMGDGNGNFHATYRERNGRSHYVIFSPEGKLVFEAVPENEVSLHACAGGSVALCESKFTDAARQSSEKRFFAVDAESGKLEELSISKDETIRKKTRDVACVVAPISDRQLAWCNRDGVYVRDVTTGKTIEAYKWSRHGINPVGIQGITVMSDGGFGVLYSEGLKSYAYVLLRPTEEKESLKTVTIAVSPYNKDFYLQMVSYFNKRYPSYIVDVREDYDELTLMTQLGAGDGPVLVDTELTGFEEMENLWQPLDGFLTQSGLADELIPQAAELGKIGDVTCGIVNQFRLEAMIVPQSGPKDWDYEGFLKAEEDFDGAALCYWATEGLEDRREMFLDVLKGGADDSYYLNGDGGKAIFGTQQFERVLKLSEKARRCPPADEGRALREGKALYEREDLITVEQVIRLRRRLVANGERVLGYPTSSGARHRIVARAPLALRSTATKEEKNVAYTFMKCMLSREAIMELMNGGLSVRRDALECQLKEYESEISVRKEMGIYDPEFMPELEWDADVAFYWELINGAEVKKPFSIGLQHVFDEEFGEYLDGRIDGKTLDDHLKNRVWLYLQEQK